MLREAAPGRVRLAATMLYRGNDRARLARRAEIARAAGVPLIAVNDVLYHHPDRRQLQDVLTCIREHLTIDKAGRRLAVNAERYLKPAAEMARLFRELRRRSQRRCGSTLRSPSRSTSCATNIPTRCARASRRRRRRSSIWPGRAPPHAIPAAFRTRSATISSTSSR